MKKFISILLLFYTAVQAHDVPETVIDKKIKRQWRLLGIEINPANYLEEAVLQQRILFLENQKSTVDHLNAILLRSPGLPDGLHTFNHLSSDEQFLYESLAYAYVLQLKPGEEPKDNVLLFNIWMQVWNPEQEVDFTGHARRYVDVLFRNTIPDPESEPLDLTALTTALEKSFRQNYEKHFRTQNALAVAYHRIGYNEYLLENWKKMCTPAEKEKFVCELFGITPKEYKTLLIRVLETEKSFEIIIAEEIKTYEIFIELIRQGEIYAATYFAHNRKGSIKNTAGTQRKKKIANPFYEDQYWQHIFDRLKRYPFNFGTFLESLYI